MGRWSWEHTDAPYTRSHHCGRSNNVGGGIGGGEVDGGRQLVGVSKTDFGENEDDKNNDDNENEEWLSTRKRGRGTVCRN